MTFTLQVSKENYTKEILRAVNTYLEMSPRELEVLTAMLDNNIITLETSEREKLRGILNMDQAILNTYIHKLKKGNNIVNINNVLSINPNVLKMVKDKSITFSFETY